MQIIIDILQGVAIIALGCSVSSMAGAIQNLSLRKQRQEELEELYHQLSRDQPGIAQSKEAGTESR